MPELPEVETIVRTLGPRLLGRTIAAVRCDWPRMFAPNPATAARGLVGRTISAVRRRGKWIIIVVNINNHRPPNHAALLLHLRMSGRLLLAAPSQPVDLHTHLRIAFADRSELRLCDARKFGRARFVSDPNAALAGLGVEPLGPAFTPDRLARLLATRSRRLKPLLLDQSVVAGLGNIYADEALHRAGLHPMRIANRLAPAEIRRLHRAIRAALRAGIAHNGASIDWVYPGGRMQAHFRVYRRGGLGCPVCHAPIRKILVAQRSTHYCPRCQPTKASARLDRISRPVVGGRQPARGAQIAKSR